jgi:hypothetical protein
MLEWIKWLLITILLFITLKQRMKWKSFVTEREPFRVKKNIRSERNYVQPFSSVHPSPKNARKHTLTERQTDNSLIKNLFEKSATKLLPDLSHVLLGSMYWLLGPTQDKFQYMMNWHFFTNSWRGNSDIFLIIFRLLSLMKLENSYLDFYLLINLFYKLTINVLIEYMTYAFL